MSRVFEPLLGTRAEVAVTGDSVERVGAAERAILDEVARLEAIFTVFDEASALHQLRRSGTTAVTELQTVIALAESWRTRTGGAFHPGTQPLADMWDLAESQGAAPLPADLQRAADALQADGGTQWLNLNAIAKGWIADRALANVLDATPGASAGWLSLGGDVVHRGAGSVRVGIEDPKRPYDNVAPMATIEVTNESLATSGGARRWWTIDQQRYPKVLDARTGWPVDRLASATVVAPAGATADVLATVALLLGTNETLALVSEVGGECFLVHDDGSVTSSSDRFRPS